MKVDSATREQIICRLIEVLNYCPDTGVFSWKETANTRSQKGKKAGCLNSSDGYYYIIFERRRHLAHRVAWRMHYGAPVPEILDHINMDRGDNRISNLRPATVTENNRNRTKQSNNTSGYKGVSLHKPTNKYHARICADKKSYSLGYFDSAELASMAYETASKEIHGEYART